MNIKSFRDDAQKVLLCILDIKKDIHYLKSLRNTIEYAKIQGINIGNIIEEIDNKINNSEENIKKIELSINNSLTNFIKTEETIKKDTDKIVFEDSMSNSDKFKLVYQRIILDKQILQDIQDKIEQWNENNLLIIDGSYIKNIRERIDNSIQKFGKEIRECLKEAQQYSKIKDNTLEG